MASKRSTDLTEIPMKLLISSGWHVTNPASRLKEIEETTESLDAIFIEGVDVDPPSAKIRALNWVAFPLGLLAIRLYMWTLSTFGRITGLSDRDLINRLSNDFQADVIPIEENYHRLLATDRYLWGIGHWGIAVIASAGVPTWVQETTPHFAMIANFLESIAPSFSSIIILVVLVFQFGIWFLIAGLMMSVFFVAATMKSRNRTMVSNIEDYVRQHSPVNGCLVIGEGHRSDIEALVNNTNLIEQKQ